MEKEELKRIERIMVFLVGLFSAFGGITLFIKGYILYAFLSYILAILSYISIKLLILEQRE